MSRHILNASETGKTLDTDARKQQQSKRKGKRRNDRLGMHESSVPLLEAVLS